MNSKEINDFCWAARHALLNLVKLEEYSVSNKIGMMNYLKEISDEDILDLTDNMLHINESQHSRILEENYKNHISKDLLINEHVFFKGRDHFLSENDQSNQLSEKAKINADTIIKIAVTTSVAQAAIRYLEWLAKAPKDALDAREYIAGRLGAKFEAIISMFPKVHNKLNPEGYANLRMTKEYLQQVAKQEAQTGVKVDPSQIQKTLGEIKVKAKESVKDRKMVKARGWLNKQVEKLTETPEAAELRRQKAREALKGKKPLHGKIALVLLGTVALSTLAYTIYKYYTDAARKSCRGHKGRAKKICILNYRITASKEAIKKLEEALPGCQEKNNPDKCKYSIQREIWQWNKRKTKYEEQYAKLTQAMNKLRR